MSKMIPTLSLLTFPTLVAFAFSGAGVPDWLAVLATIGTFAWVIGYWEMGWWPRRRTEDLR